MRTFANVTSRHNNSFGLLRLVAALLVVVSHGFLLTGGNVLAEPMLEATGYPLGAHAVHIFFALSGFLIAASWQARPELFHFLAGRFLRLFPALIGVTLGLLLVCALFLSQPIDPLYLFSPEAMLFFMRTVFLLDGGGSLASVIPQNQVSGAILATVWTLRYEVFCYLSVPLLGLVMTLSDRKSVVVVSIILAACALKLTLFGNAYHEATMLDSFARFFFAFYVGVLAFLLRTRLPRSFLIAAALVLVAYLSLNTPITKPIQITAVAYFALWIGAFRPGRVANWLDREDLSYGIYLMGYPIQQAMLYLLPHSPQHPLVNIGASLLIAVPLAFLSWRIIERPALAKRKLIAEAAENLVQRARPAQPRPKSTLG